MAAKLTSRFLETVALDPAKRLELPDILTPGLYFIVQPSGAKSWAVRYRHRGKPAKMTLGKYPLLSLADAREAARQALKDAALGNDPAEAKRRQAAALATLPETVGDLCNRYRDEHLKKRVRNWRNNQAEIETHIRPALGRYRLDELTRAHVREMVKGVVAKGYPVAANRVLVRLRAMLNWALAEDLVEVNIAAGIKKPTMERPRDRTLTDAELLAIWEATEDLSYPARHFMRLLLLTGQRRDDVREMHWDEIDLTAGTWTIPASRYKTGRSHLLPLAPTVRALLEDMPFRDRAGYVLSPSGGAKPYSAVVKPKAALDRASGVTGWTLHDIRRTVRTGLSALGIRPDIAERVIGHAVGGRLGQTYDLHEFREEKLRALLAWERHFLGLSAGNVIALVARREAR